MKERQNRKNTGMWICVGILFLLTLFMVKAEMRKGDEILLYSDFATHSTWAVGELPDPEYDKFYAYPLWHLAVRAVNASLPIGREWSAALVTALCLGLTAAVLYRYLSAQLEQKLSYGRICGLGCGLLVLTAVYVPWLNPQVYLGQSSPTIWHNPTNMAVKPLALLGFLLFLDLYRKREKPDVREMAGLSAVLLLSCFVKPSFVQGFLPAVVLFLFMELIRTRGRSFLFSLKMAAVFVPSGCYFLYQYLSVFGGGSERSIGIEPFAVMELDTAHPLCSMVQAVAFPLFVVCVLGIKRVWKDRELLFTVLFYLTALLEFILLIELNEPASGNFEWGLQLAMFALFVQTAVRFYQTEWNRRWIRTAGNLLLLCHIVSGIYYYLGLMFWLPGQC